MLRSNCSVETSRDEVPAELSVVELGRRQCLELLAGVHVGRIVWSTDGIPVAVPVNVALFDGDVVFTTDRGSKLDAVAQGQVVSLEADEMDGLYHTGWSVLVTGVAELVMDPDEIERIGRLPMQAWAPGPHPFVVRIPSTAVSGRRIEWGARHDFGHRVMSTEHDAIAAERARHTPPRVPTGAPRGPKAPPP